MKDNEKKVSAVIEDAGDGEVRITLSVDQKKRVPVVGEDVIILEPYPVDDEESMDGFAQKAVKERPIIGWGYTKVMTKTTALSDDGESVVVNGELTVCLTEKPTRLAEKAKRIVINSEDEAKEMYTTLMSASLKEADRRYRRAQEIKTYLESALENDFH